MVEAIELALKRGQGRLNVDVLPENAEAVDPGIRWRWSTGLHCPELNENSAGCGSP